MISKYATQIVFWAAVVLSVGSVALTYAGGEVFLAVIGLSVAFNVWSMLKSDREGFVKSSQIRRAYEPARHFNEAQTLVVMGLVMMQVGASAYAIMT